MNGIWAVIKATYIKFHQEQIYTHAAALAYYTVFSLPPILLIIISTTARLYKKDEIERLIFNQLNHIIGESGVQTIADTINRLGLYRPGFWTTAISITILFLLSTAVLNTLKRSLNSIFKVRSRPQKAWIVFKVVLDRLLSFGFLLLLSFTLIFLLTLSALFHTFYEYAENTMGVFGNYIHMGVSQMIPILALSILFALLYKILPDVKMQWKDALIGGLVAAILFTIGKYVIGLYIGNSQILGLYEAVGSIMILMIWVFYQSIIFLFGAVFIYVYAQHRNRPILPSKHAVKIILQEIRNLKK